MAEPKHAETKAQLEADFQALGGTPGRVRGRAGVGSGRGRASGLGGRARAAGLALERRLGARLFGIGLEPAVHALEALAVQNPAHQQHDLPPLLGVELVGGQEGSSLHLLRLCRQT